MFRNIIEVGRTLVTKLEKYGSRSLDEVPGEERLASSEIGGWFSAADRTVRDTFGEHSEEYTKWKNALTNVVQEFPSEGKKQSVWCIRYLHTAMGLLTEFEASRDSPDLAAKVYSPGGTFDVYRDLLQIIRAATQTLFLIDPYANEEIFELYLTKLHAGVSIRLLTRPPSNALRVVAAKFASRPGTRLEARWTTAIHDRVIIVDSEKCWALGQSFKDAAAIKSTYLVPVDPGQDMVAVYERTWSEARAY